MVDSYLLYLESICTSNAMMFKRCVTASLLVIPILLIPIVQSLTYSQEINSVGQTITNVSYYYVDNNLSDVDSSADKGTHSNFMAQQSGPDSNYDNLSETNVLANWLSGWQKRIRVAIDHNDINDALSNFPLLVYLSNSSGLNNDDVSCVFDELQSDVNRKKIAVTTSDGITQCYVEVEKWNNANEQAWLWVKVPNISNTSDTSLYLYYDADQADNTDYVGDPNSTPAENVWDSNFTGVWHLDDTIVGSVDIGGGSSGTPSGSPSATPTYAYFDELSTANANGFITQVKINVDTVGDGDIRIMTCSRAGNTFTVRDFENLAVTGTGVQTFSINLEVATGDYLGFWANTVSVEREAYASSQYLYQDTGTVPSIGQTYSATQGATSVRLMIEGNGDVISVLDSTNNNNDGSVIGSEETIGQIDNAQDFNGINDYINITNSASLQFTSSLTIEAWVNLESFGSGSDVDILLRKGEGNPNDWQLAIHDQRIGLRIEENDDGAGLDGSTLLTTTTWYYLAGTWNGSIRRVYLNGSEDGSGSKTGSIIPDARDIYIGGRASADLTTGIIDEVRASNTTRSPAWIKTSYESGRDDLLNFGNEEIPACEIDLEVQWTNVDYSEANEELCIYLSEESVGSNNTYSLDATGGYMIVGDGTPDWGSTTGTISFWIKMDSAVQGRFWGQDGNMETRWSGTNLVLDWGGTSSMTSATSFSPDTWYFVAIVWDENNNNLFLYVGDDNNLPTLDANSLGGTWTSTTPLPTQNRFMNGLGGDETVDGHGDDLRYWNVARTLTEIRSDYNMELTGSEANLRSYFRLNNDFDDIGPDNNDGSASGSYSFSTDVPFSDSATENLRVDVWNGSGWQNLFADLAGGWNNVTVTPYLASSMFTIRFKGGTETNDLTQDSWAIDATLLHVWS